MMDASDIYPRRIKAKEVLITQKGDDFTIPFAACSAKLSGRDHEFRVPTLRREPTVRSQDFSRELHCEPGESQPAETTDDAEARGDFWSVQGDFIYRHHNEPQVQLHVPKEETFSIQKKLMLLGLLTLIWTSCKKRRLMITGISIRASICQTFGED